MNIDIDILLSRLESLCDEKGITLNAAFVGSGVGKNFKSNLKISNPSMGKITMLANYFNVTVDYLLGKTDDPSPSNNESDSPERDPELIELENGLTPEELVELKRYGAYLLSQRNKK